MLVLAFTPITLGKMLYSYNKSSTIKENNAVEITELQVYICNEDGYEKISKQLPMDEARDLQQRIMGIQQYDIPVKERIELQLEVLKENEILPHNANLNELYKEGNKHLNTCFIQHFLLYLLSSRNTSPADEVILNGLCGIWFGFTGTGLVVGSHTFIPTFGADIAALFKGSLGTIIISGVNGEQEIDYYDGWENTIGFIVGFVGFLIFGFLGVYGPAILGIGYAGLTGWIAL